MNVITGVPSRSSAFNIAEVPHPSQINAIWSGIVRIASNLVDPHVAHTTSALLSLLIVSLLSLSIAYLNNCKWSMVMYFSPFLLGHVTN
jgi:hypothetical protein